MNTIICEGENELNLFYEKGDVNYDQLENISHGIERGNIAVERLNPEEEQGRIAGGRRNVEASILAGTSEKTSGNAKTTSSSLSWDEHKQTVKSAEALLEEYAEKEGGRFDYKTGFSHKVLYEFKVCEKL